MAQDYNRIEKVIEVLQNAFKNSDIANRAEDYQEGSLKDDLLLSVIIPARGEFPNVVHTIYSIWHCWEAEGFDPDRMEIIIVNNCSKDWENEKWDSSKPGDKGTTEYLMARGAYLARKVRVIYDPIAGNHSARNKGARIARGKYLFFSDAHMAYKPGSFTAMFETLQETHGMFHFCIGWMGAYPASTSGVGCGYTLKLGEEIKGTWNNYYLSEDHYFYIPALGHCSVGVERKQFLEFGGYPDIHRSYGGGEFYINMKWWMFGSSVVTHPKAIGYHLASGRGYTWTHDDYIHNVFNIGYALGMDAWLERAYFNWLRNGRKEMLDRMMAEARVEMAKDREFIKNRSLMTFNELIVARPWESMNKEMLGRGNPCLLIFHPTWLNLIKQSPAVQELYDASPLQKELETFIKENLWEHVYKPDTKVEGEIEEVA